MLMVSNYNDESDNSDESDSYEDHGDDGVQNMEGNVIISSSDDNDYIHDVSMDNVDYEKMK